MDATCRQDTSASPNGEVPAAVVVAPARKKSSKPMARKLETLDQRYPHQWKGKLVRYTSLVDTLDLPPGPEKHADNEQEFFGKLFREIEKVNCQFRSAAKAVISAYRRKSWWKALLQPFSRPEKVKLGGDADGVEITPETLALHTQICLEYAQVSAEAIRKVAEDHDRAFGNEHGRIILDSMWKTHSGVADFLHSPLLSELEAVARTMSLPGEDSAGGEASREDGCDGGGDSSAPDGHSECDDEEDEALQCPICLDMLYKPVGLSCGHKFCATCLMKATAPGRYLGHVEPVLSRMNHKCKCPQCRQTGVFKNASVLTVLGEGLKAKYPKYYNERAREERIENRKSKDAVIKHLESRGLVYPSFFAQL